MSPEPKPTSPLAVPDEPASADSSDDEYDSPDAAGDRSVPTPTVASDEDGVCAERGAVCYDLTDAQAEALANYDNGGKTVVCDPTCLDSSVDNQHCNCEWDTFISGI